MTREYIQYYIIRLLFKNNIKYDQTYLNSLMSFFSDDDRLTTYRKSVNPVYIGFTEKNGIKYLSSFTHWDNPLISQLTDPLQLCLRLYIRNVETDLRKRKLHLLFK
jgi:hypothetical protein